MIALAEVPRDTRRQGELEAELVEAIQVLRSASLNPLLDECAGAAIESSASLLGLFAPKSVLEVVR